MADDNKPMKYLRYAIGEIILVVIGILIALQVNNWNEDRKTQLQEIKILKEIKLDLISTRDEVQSDLNAHLSILDRTQRLLNHILHNKPENDSIVTYMLGARSDLQAYPKSSGFEALKSIGIDLIKNDSLRTQITNFYQLNIKRVVEVGRKENPTDNLGTRMEPYILKYLAPDTNLNNLMSYQIIDTTMIIPPPIIKNYNEMIVDLDFIQALIRSMIIRADYIERHDRCVKNSNRIIQHIENELKQLES